MAKSLTINSNLSSKHELVDRAQESLRVRMANFNVPYSQQEIRDVSGLRVNLFPPEMELSKEVSERMRMLCKLSELRLEESVYYRSHRKIIGPLVVALKRLTFPFVKFHISSTIDTAREFQIRAVEQIAAQETELWKLRCKLQGILN